MSFKEIFASFKPKAFEIGYKFEDKYFTYFVLLRMGINECMLQVIYSVIRGRTFGEKEIVHKLEHGIVWLADSLRHYRIKSLLL